MDERSQALRNSELMPTKDSDRTLSLKDYTVLWAGMTINIVAFSLGAQYYNGGEGLSPLTLIFVVFLGYGLVTVLTAMTGDIGIKFGIPFAVYGRAAFGYKGAYLAGLIRCIPCFYWFGFQTWVGATALNLVLQMFFPGFNNLTLMIILFGAFQIINALFGLKAMAKFDWIAVACLTVMFGAIVLSICNVYGVTIPDILAIKAKGNYSFAFAVSGIAGGWVSMSLNGSDLTRNIRRNKDFETQSFFKRNKNAILGQVIGLMLVGILAMVIGMIAGIYTGEWDLNAVIGVLYKNKPVFFGFCLLSVVLAQWSTNTAANLMPPAYILINIISKAKFWMMIVVSGIIGIAMQPWKQQNGDFLVTIQANFSTLLGPVIGILLADYFIIRKGKVNVQDLFTAGGQYEYTKGFNLSAVASLAGAFALSLLAGDYAFYAGLILSVVFYIVLMKTFTLKKHEQNLGTTIYFEEES